MKGCVRLKGIIFHMTSVIQKSSRCLPKTNMKLIHFLMCIVLQLLCRNCFSLNWMKRRIISRFGIHSILSLRDVRNAIPIIGWVIRKLCVCSWCSKRLWIMRIQVTTMNRYDLPLYFTLWFFLFILISYLFMFWRFYW